MDDSTGFEPNETQRVWLDSLPDESRPLSWQMLETTWRFGHDVGKLADRVADLMLPHAKDEVWLNQIMSFALWAESSRAMGQGEWEVAREFATRAFACHSGDTPDTSA